MMLAEIGALAVAESPKPYDLEPDPEAPASSKEPAPREEPAPSKPPAKIEGPDLMEGIDEDEVPEEPEKPVTVVRPARRARPVEEPAEPVSAEFDFVKPGFGNFKIIGIAGLVVMTAAMVVAAITSNQRVAAALLTGYQTLLHAGTGIIAVVVGALLNRRAVGRFDLAGARMLLAVAAFHLCVNLEFGLSTTRAEEVLAGIGAYVLVIFSLFRFPPRVLLDVIVCHAGLWLVVWLGTQLEIWSRAAPAAPAGPA